MNLIYVCPQLAFRKSMGAKVRRDGIIDGLKSRGHSIEIIEVGGEKTLFPQLLRFRLRTDRSSIKQSFEEADALIIEGLPLALSELLLPIIRKGLIKIHVDICDSWLLLSSIDGRARNNISQALFRVVKKSIALWALQKVNTNISISYSNQRDLMTDARYLSAAQLLVVDNSFSAEQLEVKAFSYDDKGPILVLGDGGYSPNQAMLEEAIQWLERSDPSLIHQIRLVGPNWESFKHERVENLGWVDDLAEAFEGIFITFAVLRNGAGTKNKIIEALGRGYFVLGLASTVSPIQMASPGWVEFIGQSPEEIKRELSRRPMAQTIPVPTWSELVIPIERALGD